ncbi:MAG: flagellar filament capping protein FliD [Lachnospiraceae bacterium]
MANLTTLSVYNHYLTSYAPKGTTSLDTHKKSELRNIYNSIVKLNKESPLYILDDSDDSKAFAIGLKENARELQNSIASLGGLDEAALLNKKAAFSSDESIASVSFIGNSDEASTAPELSLEVRSLASPQVNMGQFIPSDTTVALKPDTYSFDLSINELNYEFQFQIRPEDTNIDVQNRLTRLFNNADIGIHAETLDDGSGNSSLKLTSQKSGAPADSGYIFRVSDDQTSKTSGIVDYLGIGDITRYPSNAEFSINGMERTASSNNFTVERLYEITLNGVSPEEGMTTEIGIKTDTESLTENLRQLFGSYNQFLRSAIEYTEKHPKSNQLVSEMWHLAGSFAEPLSQIGVNITEDGSIDVDDNTLRQSILDGRMAEGLDQVKDFTKALYRKSGQITLNPMTYVEKTIVAYKNPGKNYASPYITSAYSGMLFNSYC